MELPEQYSGRMKEMLGAEFADYLAALDCPRVTSLRVNRQKWNGEEARGRLSFLREAVPWATDGYYYAEDGKPSRHPAYYAGLYYLQEASAMSPGAVLPVKAGDRVLDLCAAPGGKSTQIAAGLGRSGVLYANDISASRAQALLKNLELAGAGNIFVTAEKPEKLALHFPEYFDSILVDAPCSGEGMFGRDARLVREWMQRGPEYYQPLQKAILEQACMMLKPGGYVLYSTCTFSRDENEGNVERILAAHPEMELVTLERREGFSDGFLPGTIRIWPQRTRNILGDTEEERAVLRGEGHFLALLRKKETGVATTNPGRERSDRMTVYEAHHIVKRESTAFRRKKGRGRQGAVEKKSADHKNSSILRDKLVFPSGCQFAERGDFLYVLPAGERVLPGLHYLRTGLLLGEWKRERFLPSQALAMALRAEEYPDRVSFAWNDERAVRYLKGETLQTEGAKISGEEGQVLVCLDRFPLGWAVRRGNSLKNRYNPGWRWQ